MKQFILFALLIFAHKSCIAQTPQDTTAIINQFFQRYQSGKPGGQLAISLNGKVIFSKAWGLAELEHLSPYTTTTLNEAGSISKQFTAASVLLLDQQGKLSLDDDIRKFFPELPDYGFVIRVRNLMHHTSGLREWSELVAITGWPRFTRAYRNEDVLKLLCTQSRLNNPPGTEFIYSNSNYVLLALIVEKISGMSLPAFTKKYIFEPSGMVHTTWRDDYKKVVPNRAIAYAKSDSLYRINMPNENVYGPGGLLTTAEDLLKWNEYYLNNKLGVPGLLTKQLAIDPFKDGGNADYAAGLYVDDMNGIKQISHDGQTAGYVAFLESFPSQKLSIAWLSNTTEFKANLFEPIDRIEKMFLKSVTSSGAEKLATINSDLSLAMAKNHVGWYRNNTTNGGIKIDFKNDTLYFKNVALIPTGTDAFIYGESKIKFNKPGSLILTTYDKRKILITRQPVSKITNAYLKAFCGSYFSKETQSDLLITFKDGKLMIEKDYIRDIPLIPTYTQAFNFDLVLDSSLFPTTFNIVFEKNKKTGVIKCKVSADDARNVVFEKINRQKQTPNAFPTPNMH